MSALQLYAVAALEGDGRASLAPETGLITFRDLAAVVTEVPYLRAGLSGPDLTRYREVIQTVFAEHAVLPAPPGVIFRSPETLQRWMELHYVVLADGLAFVEGRWVARIHLRRAPGSQGAVDDEAEADLAASTSASFRALRRHAIAAVPLKTEAETDVLLSSSFLVAREQWEDFTGAVAEEQRRHPELRYEQTGPWPPYDFVQMQFGG